MRLHTDTITYVDLFDAVRHIEGVYLADPGPEQTGSKTRDHAFTVKLEALERKGRRRVNFGTANVDRYDPPFAATWDEWGFFLAYLFDVDPNLIAGNNYSGLDHYQWCTGGRFVGREPVVRVGTPHDQHRWEHKPNPGGPSLGCKCGAVMGNRGRWAFPMERTWTDRAYPVTVSA